MQAGQCFEHKTAVGAGFAAGARAIAHRHADRGANQGLAPVEQVRKFRLLEKELDHDDNEVTATMKVRRKTIYEKFAPLIREIYQ